MVTSKEQGWHRLLTLSAEELLLLSAAHSGHACGAWDDKRDALAVKLSVALNAEELMSRMPLTADEIEEVTTATLVDGLPLDVAARLLSTVARQQAELEASEIQLQASRIELGVTQLNLKQRGDELARWGEVVPAVENAQFLKDFHRRVCNALKLQAAALEAAGETLTAVAKEALKFRKLCERCSPVLAVLARNAFAGTTTPLPLTNQQLVTLAQQLHEAVKVKE